MVPIGTENKELLDLYRRIELKKNEDLGNATQPIETEDETENTSRRRQAFQDYGHRQTAEDAFRQASPVGNQSARAYAQTQKDDQGQQSRQAQDHADASLRLEISAFFIFVSGLRPIGRKFRNQSQS
jgi:hypothetical protein